MHANEPQVNELAELLTDLLVDYAIPLSKRQSANAEDSQSNTKGSTVAHSRLRREAKQLLIRYSKENKGRYGEVGELLSYAIAVHFLSAAQIGSKMALKTASGMPIHGVDGLHARANHDGTVTFFLLESKLIPDATDATRDMVKSIAEYQADRARKLNELRLVSDLSNLDALRGEQREAAKSYFNVYEGKGKHLLRRDMHVGSLVFNEEAYQQNLPLDHSQPIDIYERHIEKLYAAKHSRMKDNLARQARDNNLDLGSCVVFLIAIPEIDNLKRIFAELNQ
nr:DUF1837 domain-containing protein [Pseudomonas sp. A29(2023)]